MLYNTFLSILVNIVYLHDMQDHDNALKILLKGFCLVCLVFHIMFFLLVKLSFLWHTYICICILPLILSTLHNMQNSGKRKRF